MIEPGSDVREKDLLTRKNPQPRFTVKSKIFMGGNSYWEVYDEALQIVVFHWYGKTGEVKSNAVAKALNDLGHEKD